MVSHKDEDLVCGHRLPIRPVFTHIQLNNDGLETFPSLLVRDVEEPVVARTREERIDVHTVGDGARRQTGGLDWGQDARQLRGADGCTRAEDVRRRE